MRRLRADHAALLLLATLAIAVAVQASRVPMRWSQVAIAYGAYVAEWRQAASTSGAWVTTWVGLHPPLFAGAFAAALKLGVPPAGWLIASGAASVSSVVTVAVSVFVVLGPRGRTAALLAGAFVALSPHRVAYGLEINSYPLLVGMLGAQGLAFALWAQRGTRAPLVITSALLPWTHLLGATALIGQMGAAALVDRERLRPLLRLYVVAGIAMLPLLPGLLGALGDPINAPVAAGGVWAALLRDLPGRYGLSAAGWATAGLALLGVMRAWRQEDRLVPVSWAVCAVLGSVAVLGALASAQASAAQFPYWLVPLLPTLTLAGLAIHGRERHQGLALAAAAILLANGASLAFDAIDARWQRDRAGLSHPITTGALTSWGPGEVLLLVGLPWAGDDDKDVVDPVWASVPLLRSLDYADPGVEGLTPADPYWGQPVRWRDGRWLYTFTTLNVGRLQAVARAHASRGQRVRVAAYGLQRYPTATRELKNWARGQGATLRGSTDEIGFEAGLSPSGRPAPVGGASPPR